MRDNTLSNKIKQFNDIHFSGETGEYLEGLAEEAGQLEAENKALKEDRDSFKAFTENVIELLNRYDDSQTSDEYKQTLDDFHYGVFLLGEGIQRLKLL